MSSKVRILIVDDNDDVREVLALILAGAGYHTVQARNGHEAVDVARQVMPDAIVMDVFMPDLDGVRASEIIQGHTTLAKIPIILQTAKPSAARERADLFFEVLAKPCDPDAVLECLDRALIERGIVARVPSLVS